MAELNCRTELLEGKPLTVGDRFTWACEGAVPNFDFTNVELRLEEADKYKLKLFGVQKSEQGALLIDTTSYMVGDHTLKAVQLVDLENSILLGDLKFQVSSVQDPKEPVQEPFGPMGPQRFFPTLFFGLLVTALILFLIPIFLGVIQRRRRRKLMETLDSKSFQYAAFPELHRELRALERQHLFLADHRTEGSEDEKKISFETMKSAFRVYLSRQYRIPAFNWRSAAILKALFRETNLRPEALKEVAVTLREIERAEKDSSKQTSMDLFQLLKMIKNTSEVIEKEGRRA